MSCLRSLLTFFTIIPAKSYDIEEAARCFPLIPFIGLIISFIGTLPLFFAQNILTALLSFLILYILTGLNHIDGFADFIDVIASRKVGEEALKVLKEPWRGAFSQASITMLMLTVFVSIHYLKSDLLSIVLAHIFSYNSMFLIAILGTPPPYRGLGRIFIEASASSKAKISNALALTSSLLIIYLMAFLLDINIIKIIFYTIISFILSLLIVFISLHQARRTLGFANGDVMGYTLELSRALNLLALAIANG